MSVDNIKKYVESFGIFGEPVEYKGLSIYPITMKDAYGFNKHIEIMNIDKNNMGDIEIIQMSYLYFLINLFSVNIEK